MLPSVLNLNTRGVPTQPSMTPQPKPQGPVVAPGSISPALGCGLSPYQQALPPRISDADQKFKKGLAWEFGTKAVLDVVKGLGMGAGVHEKLGGDHGPDQYQPSHVLDSAQHSWGAWWKGLLHGPDSRFNVFRLLPANSLVDVSAQSELVNGGKVVGYIKTGKSSIEGKEAAEKSGDEMDVRNQVGMNGWRATEMDAFLKEKVLLISGGLLVLAKGAIVPAMVASGIAGDDALASAYLMSTVVGLTAFSRYYDLKGLISGIMSADYMKADGLHGEQRAHAYEKLRPANQKVSALDHEILEVVREVYSPQPLQEIDLYGKELIRLREKLEEKRVWFQGARQKLNSALGWVGLSVSRLNDPYADLRSQVDEDIVALQASFSDYFAGGDQAELRTRFEALKENSWSENLPDDLKTEWQQSLARIEQKVSQDRVESDRDYEAELMSIRQEFSEDMLSIRKEMEARATEISRRTLYFSENRTFVGRAIDFFLRRTPSGLDRSMLQVEVWELEDQMDQIREAFEERVKAYYARLTEIRGKVLPEAERLPELELVAEPFIPDTTKSNVANTKVTENVIKASQALVTATLVYGAAAMILGADTPYEMLQTTGDIIVGNQSFSSVLTEGDAKTMYSVVKGAMENTPWYLFLGSAALVVGSYGRTSYEAAQRAYHAYMKGESWNPFKTPEFNYELINLGGELSRFTGGIVMSHGTPHWFGRVINAIGGYGGQMIGSLYRDHQEKLKDAADESLAA